MVASAGRGNLESKRPWPRRERGPRGQPAWGGTQGAAISAGTARHGGRWPAGRAVMVGQPRADPSLPQSRHTAVSPAQASIWGQGHAEGQTVFSGRYAEPRPKSWPPKSVGLTCWTVPCCAQPLSTQGPGRLRNPTFKRELPGSASHGAALLQLAWGREGRQGTARPQSYGRGEASPSLKEKGKGPKAPCRETGRCSQQTQGKRQSA